MTGIKVDWKLSIGNILVIAVLIGGGISGWFGLTGRVDDNAVKIDTEQNRLSGHSDRSAVRLDGMEGRLLGVSRSIGNLKSADLVVAAHIQNINENLAKLERSNEKIADLLFDLVKRKEASQQ